MIKNIYYKPPFIHDDLSMTKHNLVVEIRNKNSNLGVLDGPKSSENLPISEGNSREMKTTVDLLVFHLLSHSFSFVPTKPLEVRIPSNGLRGPEAHSFIPHRGTQKVRSPVRSRPVPQSLYSTSNLSDDKFEK